MESLRKKRGVVKGSLTRLEKLVTEANEGSVSIIDAQIKLEKVEDVMKMFERLQMEIEMLMTDEEVENEISVREEYEAKYYSIKAMCLKVLSRGTHIAESTVITSEQITASLPNPEDKNTNEGEREDEGNARVQDNASSLAINEHDETLRQLTASQNAIAAALASVSEGDRFGHQGISKLPTCPLPTFSGDFREWPTYKDLFKTLVHNSIRLSGAQKLQYLKLSLKDDAASVLKHTNICDANYEQAWRDLCAMYDKEKVIINTHIKTIMEQADVGSNPVASDIRRVHNTTNESVSALKSLGLPVEYWDAWLIYVVLAKLDSESRKLWARSSASNDKPAFRDILLFLTNRQFELEAFSNKKAHSNMIPKSNRHSVLAAISLTCAMCGGAHFIASCPQFCDLDLNGKRNIIAQKGLCYNCLNTGHSVKACSSGTCRKCKARHHTSIHTEFRYNSKTPTNLTSDTLAANQTRDQKSIEKPKAVLSATSTNEVHKFKCYNLLPTAIVLVRNRFGELKPCRVLFDSGSQVTLITEACVQFLGLARQRCSLAINAVGDSEAKARGTVSLSIKSRTSEFWLSSQAIVLSRITSLIPQHRVSFNQSSQMGKIELADPSFGEPGVVDILLKSGILFKVLTNGRIYDNNSQLIAQNTRFGWLLASQEDEPVASGLSTFHAVDNMDNLWQRFWEVEEPKPTSRQLFDDHPCETHFKTHYRRDVNGRFVVRLPFKDFAKVDGDTRGMAERRLRAMERRFERDEDLRVQYSAFMEEYKALGHMVEINVEQERETGYYLPHHSVIKMDSTTTRLRVVFDATCTPPGGTSLNSQLLTGPVLQNDLMTILIQFKLNPVALSADIAKMYRQILVHPDDRKYQRILWRDSTGETMKEYELTTVTYGTSPASFLATRCLTQLAKDGKQGFPEAASMINDFFYMDDFIASCTSEESARVVVGQLCELLQGAGFHIRKWATNSRELLEEIPLERREVDWTWSPDENQAVKTLGLRWHPVTDCFSFKVVLTEVSCYTKRNLMSEAARIFDPLGFLAPFLINYKILLQNLWQEKVEWDDQVPLKLIKRWQELRDDIKGLEELSLPRYKPHSKPSLEMHGFCDASEVAYAAVVYLRSTLDSGKVITSFVAAKTKVAPLKPALAIPRLELCAASLLAKLVSKIQESKGYSDIPVYGWTDSTIVLHWLNGHPRRFATFIANRISAVTTVIPATHWRHVKGEINPADCASRGLGANLLINHRLWWNGPDNILTDPSLFETFPNYSGNKQSLEERKIVLSAFSNEAYDNSYILEKYSSFAQLLRITALLLRFKSNCQTKVEAERKKGWLTTEELSGATNALVKMEQYKYFSEDIAGLQEGVPLRTTQLIKLHPILDTNGLLRVGGRIGAAPLGYNQKHPLILSNASPLTKLIIEYSHQKHLHAGPQLLLALLRHDYWIIGARNTVRKIIHRCVVCQRFSAKPMQQRMGNLPASRLTGEKAFLNTGVDFAGPLLATPWRKRGCRGQKVYVAVFICLCTKAIHLEMVSGLSTEAFMLTLKRFIARRGKCSNLYCDNGTNFVGTRNLLNELDTFLKSKGVQGHLQKEASKETINWHFIPPAAPNFGGLWEAAVKSTKFHLRRVVGSTLLSFEELQTLLCQIESCLNSRPLVAMSDEVEEFEPLTPSHFLVGSRPYFMNEPDYLSTNINRLSRFQMIDRLQQAFWKRWQLEYVSTLQKRNKWQKETQNLSPNNLVLIIDDNQPPGKWLLGRVKEVHCGTDGLARVATLITKNGLVKRPISKMCLLNLK